MPHSICCECERHAARYWGMLAYCGLHIEDAKLEDPHAHKCPVCAREQPAHVAWRHSSPCRECKSGKRGES